MKILNAIGLSAFQLLSCVFVVGYFLGVLNNYFSDKNNYCAMTYMFEYPQFVRISLEDNKIYPQYGLFAYSEGRFTERARRMWFDGIPVLFLPGNSGSHMQVRSIASVALRKALSQEYDYHFDYFTISYNEELSGLYGGVLQSQTQFASACVAKILSLYKNNKYTKTVPTSVILIGHSMGGLIAKRLLAYPSTINTTNIAITLAAPLEAPVVNFDPVINDYYMLINLEWEAYINRHEEVKRKKFLISVGSGPRDVLIPAGLTSSNDSQISALATSIPGVWVTPDHVSMVWCKQLVMVVNRFLFDIVDPLSEQVTDDSSVMLTKAEQHFQSNRSMILNPMITRKNVTMQADAFWYEDNRRIYQISRPEIDRTTHLMIRLVSFPQNRFVAVESVNVQDKDWIFGCNAKNVYHSYRYCKEATSLSELSRWTGSVPEFGKRKLATVNLHKLMELEPEWTHVIVKVSPTKKPVVLNVDINDHASRQIDVKLPSDLSFGKQIIKAETEANSLYYELILSDLSVIHQAYLLYVEPTSSCQEASYHVSAELHVPWAKNHEYHHYFTDLKKSPMKVRLFKSNPNVTLGLDSSEKAMITLLLDPKCTFSISISTSWYYRLGQLSRNYTPVLVPYVAAIILLAARSNILHLKEHGTCVSIHSALMSEGVKPYYALVFGRLGSMALMSIPFFSFLFENASWKNLELQYFSRSLLVLPAYMTALGILNISAAAVLVVMVFSSQLAHRLLFRIVWRGGTGLAEKMAAGLQKVPMVVSAALVCAVPLSCGAASLAAGAAFYAFVLSKMYEEYLEDYVYRLVSKVASKMCRLFKPKKDSTRTIPIKDVQSTQTTTSENVNDNTISPEDTKNEKNDSTLSGKNDKTEDERSVDTKALVSTEQEEPKEKCDNETNNNNNIDEDLNNINFHLMLFFMWMSVAIVNIPALLTWAQNFKYSMVLKPDTSYHTGLVMSACSAVIWQMNGPRRNLRHYETVSALLFTMAVFILALGPFSLSIVNYGVTFMFTIITIQQLLDTEDPAQENHTKEPVINIDADTTSTLSNKEPVKADEPKENITAESENEQNKESGSNEGEKQETSNECDVCNENRIYNIFRNLREKLSFGDNL
ncbi:GPI inositol-deacylase isoform X3 [Maniola jurtina]|uniref:GPI inositol-deacylase isoform X3 n=1 Tax=Maniola jurtina TaxID=191418 RepID=UPI001E689F70|nr:GPI inositol-deacylase isoform X3 [Maniola jurtina]